jgi:hypothetical protein
MCIEPSRSGCITSSRHHDRDMLLEYHDALEHLAKGISQDEKAIVEIPVLYILPTICISLNVRVCGTFTNVHYLMTIH